VEPYASSFTGPLRRYPTTFPFRGIEKRLENSAKPPAEIEALRRDHVIGSLRAVVAAGPNLRGGRIVPFP